MKSYYRFDEFSITPHPIKAQLACERFRSFGGKRKEGDKKKKKKLLCKQPNQHGFNCGMCFCKDVFTPCSVFNAVRGKKRKCWFVLQQRISLEGAPYGGNGTILRSLLPGGEAIKPYPKSREKRQGGKRPLQAFSGIRDISYVKSEHT